MLFVLFMFMSGSLLLFLFIFLLFFSGLIVVQGLKVLNIL